MKKSCILQNRKEKLVERVALHLYVFVNLLNVWLICFCICSVMVAHIACLRNTTLYTFEQLRVKGQIMLFYKKKSFCLPALLEGSWGPLAFHSPHFENCHSG